MNESTFEYEADRLIADFREQISRIVNKIQNETENAVEILETQNETTKGEIDRIVYDISKNIKMKTDSLESELRERCERLTELCRLELDTATTQFAERTANLISKKGSYEKNAEESEIADLRRILSAVTERLDALESKLKK